MDVLKFPKVLIFCLTIMLIGAWHVAYSFALEACNSTTTVPIDFKFEIYHVSTCLLVLLMNLMYLMICE